MSEKPTISDETSADAVSAAAAAHEAQAGADHGHPGAEHEVHHIDLHEQLPIAHLDAAATGYGHDDPASLAGSIKLDLHNPELAHADQPTLDQPIWGQPEPIVSPAAAAPTSTGGATAPSWSQLPPVLAHLAQVGLTSSDQWEEQIQPRLQQLHEDIAQVHAQLDVLERQKPKK